MMALLFVAPLAAADSHTQIDVTGRYHSNWDDVRLVQNGDRVSGTYVCCGGGTIEGRIIEGRTLRYRWTQPGGQGLGIWDVAANRLDGTWGSGKNDHDGGRWDLTRVQTQSASIAK